MTQAKPSAVALSDRGKKRERNEDAFLLMPEVGVYAVADGMGGHAGGARASSLSIQSVRAAVLANKGLEEAIKIASRRVFEETFEHPELRGMGTTTTALHVSEHQVTMAHVGDSRAYLIRDGFIEQISDDHSLVQEQYRAGLLSLEQTKNSRYRNVITRCVGFETRVEVDMRICISKPGDLWLLCTDGLTNLLEDAEILELVSMRDPERAAQELINHANFRGGNDNITVLLVYV